MALSDYIISSKPAKLPLINSDGEDTGDYLEVISASSAKIAREKSTYQFKSLKLQRELNEMDERANGNTVLPADWERKLEITNIELKEVAVEYASVLVCGSSFEDVSVAELSELLNEGNISNAIIALANDSDRLKKN